jgi:hypothetical protein
MNLYYERFKSSARYLNKNLSANVTNLETQNEEDKN